MASLAEFSRIHRAAQAGLTPDELDCMAGLAMGQPLKPVGDTDHLLQSAQTKLGARNLFNALALAALAGLIGKDVVDQRDHANDSLPAGSRA